MRWTSLSKHGLDLTQRKRTTTLSTGGGLVVLLGSINHKKMVFKNAFVFQSPNFQRRTPFILLSQYNNGTFYAQWVKLSTRLHFNVEYLHKPTSRPNNVIASHFRYQLLLGKRGTASLEKTLLLLHLLFLPEHFVCLLKAKTASHNSRSFDSGSVVHLHVIWYNS